MAKKTSQTQIELEELCRQKDALLDDQAMMINMQEEMIRGLIRERKTAETRLDDILDLLQEVVERQGIL